MTATIYRGILDKSQKMADNSKNGTAIINGERYVLTFNHNDWHYEITKNDELIVNLNVKGLANAKKELKKWLNS